VEKPEFLFHFSEDPTIEVFRPQLAPTQQVEGEFVWTVIGSRVPSYWFPRQCPRATWWSVADTTERVHVIEWSWLEPMRTCELYVYRFEPAGFAPADGSDWCWTSTQTVVPVDVAPVGPLLHKHRDAGIELRVVPDGQLLVLWDDVITRPGIDFSGIRLRNATPRP
jgi:hypothetical protein